MGQYSIKQLEGLSGIKAHTIRIWEQRYQLLVPHRTDTNIRFYDDDHLKKILNVALLNEKGFKISKIANFSENQILETVKGLEVEKDPEFSKDSKMKSLILALLKLDEALFHEIIDSELRNFGFYSTIKEVIYPLLNSIGLLWGIQKVNPAQEHFISNLIRQKIITATENLKNNPSHKTTFVLYLPENELHEMGLLVANYFLRQKGHRTIYLGQNVPKEDLKVIVEESGAQNVLTFMTTKASKKKVETHLNFVTKTNPGINIFLSGNLSNLEKMHLNENVTLIRSMDEFLSLI